MTILANDHHLDFKICAITTSQSLICLRIYNPLGLKAVVITTNTRLVEACNPASSRTSKRTAILY